MVQEKTSVSILTGNGNKRQRMKFRVLQEKMAKKNNENTRVGITPLPNSKNKHKKENYNE